MSTLIDVASAITWLFVSTAPDDEITMPVPAARPCASVVLMLTIAGVTLDAIALALIEPLDDEPLREPLPFEPEPPGLTLLPFDPLPPKDGTFGNAVLDDPLLSCTATATTVPMPADASTSATAAIAARTRLPVVVDDRGGRGCSQPAVPHPPPDGGAGGGVAADGGWGGHDVAVGGDHDGVGSGDQEDPGGGAAAL